MRRKYAILIDAGFIKRKLGSQSDPLTAQRVLSFTETIQRRKELSELYLHRIYYYDAEPLGTKKPKPLTGGSESWEEYDFGKTEMYRHNIRLLDELKKLPYFAVRLGEVNFRGWLVKPNKLKPTNKKKSINVTSDDLMPNAQQKGVDMRIGLDISSLTLKKQVDVIVLVTGDSDFIPALKFARREGTQVFLYTLGHAVKPEVFAHADICVQLGASALGED